MPDASIVIARPTDADQLVLLFHGVGSSAANLAPLGQAVARARPGAMVVSVDAPHAASIGSGRQWFSVAGITEQSRPQRIAQAMPLFLESIGRWQQAAGMGPERTTLIGFSQGAILALESTQVDAVPPPAARVVAVAGRLAERLRRAPEGVRFHLIHGNEDPVVPARYSHEARQALDARGTQATLDLLPGLGHGIDARAAQLVIGYLGEPNP